MREFYCSKDCQKTDWPFRFHKRFCNELVLIHTYLHRKMNQKKISYYNEHNAGDEFETRKENLLIELQLLKTMLLLTRRKIDK